jgi:hypothetical protein
MTSFLISFETGFRLKGLFLDQHLAARFLCHFKIVSGLAMKAEFLHFEKYLEIEDRMNRSVSLNLGLLLSRLRMMS